MGTIESMESLQASLKKITGIVRNQATYLTIQYYKTCITVRAK